ncbi:MAG: hypothetical protein D3904_13690 [Candidatus Electrothrix sp. EH2]|nr:hypothetical protein [Candidatus Electrothrix sp. EH2]
MIYCIFALYSVFSYYRLQPIAGGIQHIEKESDVKKQRVWQVLLAATFIFLLVPWLAQADIDPATVQKLLAPDGADRDYFSDSVAVSDDTAVIGAFGDDDVTGSVYVFTYTSSGWNLQQKLIADDKTVGDFFGCSVAIYGDTIIIGSRHNDSYEGAAYVFTRTGSVWSQKQKLQAPDRASNDYNDNFGSTVSIYGDTAVIGATGMSNSNGAAYVFTRTGGVWSPQQKLTADDGAAGDFFGQAVAIYDDTVVVGVMHDDSEKGATYVFTRIGSVWSQKQKLIADDGAAGDYFGCSVSMDGDTLLIGAYCNNNYKGSVYVFIRTGGVWSQQQKLIAGDGCSDDWFGCSVALHGDTSIIGAYNDDNVGSAYIFTRTNGLWTKQAKLMVRTGPHHFGESVAVSEDAAVISAAYDDENGYASGSTYVYGGSLGSANLVPVYKLLLLKD